MTTIRRDNDNHDHDDHQTTGRVITSMYALEVDLRRRREIGM